MKAIGFRRPLPITEPEALVEVELPRPVPGPRDLLVRVAAVSVNPVDTKVRRSADPGGEVRVLGFDAAGVVEAVGAEVTLFRPGEAVFYAGAIDRAGSNAEHQLVDERIVGAKPRSLDFAAAAALPLTSLTAWEMLFDRLAIRRDASAGRTLLIIGAAGGVGSMAVQLARRLTDLTVIGTASRPETAAWVRELGAHHTLDHGRPMPPQLQELGIAGVDYLFSTTMTDRHFPAIVEMMAPQGRFGLIDDPETIDVRLLKRKSVSLHWELMFTRSLFQTPDMARQHEILDEVARLVDDGTLRTTLAEQLGRIDAENLTRAHAMVESGRTRGKIVLAGF